MGRIRSKVQALVYLFIGLTGLAAAAIAYFALTFTIIEAFLAGLVVVAMAIVLFERTMRQRAEDDLARRIEDLSKLLSTDAHAGQVLSQRVNEIANINPGQRLTDLEADVSVLGTVVQQVAESVADVERFQTKLESKIGSALEEGSAESGEPEAKWKLTAQDVERALHEGRIECQLQKIVSLPQRRPAAYDVIAHVKLPSGETATIDDIGPGRGRDMAIQSIEKLAREKAFALAKQAATAEAGEIIHTALSRTTLSDPVLADEIAEMLDASTSAAKKMSFIFDEQEWRQLSAMERTALSAIVEKGARISIDNTSSLRLNFPDLYAGGVTSVRAEASRFVNEPGSYTEFHSSDIADYIRRYDVNLLVENVLDEQQILSLIEDNVQYAMGRHVAPLTPIPDNLFAPGGESLKPKAMAMSRSQAGL